MRLRFVAARVCGVNLEVSSSSSAPLRRFGLGRYLVGGGIPDLKKGRMRSRWKPQKKFFNETCGKYDVRYFRSEVHPPESIVCLTEALAVFMTVCVAAKVRPFLGHGTLLGWWWSRELLPWDDDVDLLIAHPELVWLESLRGRVFDGHYLLEINPNHVVHSSRNRTYRDQEEPDRIDARFIDIRNGSYIDVTALHAISGDRFSTKCPHVFPKDWLFPLQPAVLADIPVLVPCRVEDVLRHQVRTRGSDTNPLQRPHIR